MLKVILTSIFLLISTTNITNSKIAENAEAELPGYTHVDKVNPDNYVEKPENINQELLKYKFLFDLDELINPKRTVTQCGSSTMPADVLVQYWFDPPEGYVDCEGFCLVGFCCEIEIVPV